MTMHQSTSPSLSQTIWARWASRQFLSLPIVQILLTVTFGYSLSSEAVVMKQLRRWKRLWQRSLTRSHKRTSMGPWRNCWNGTTSALQPEEITSKGTRVSCVYYQQKYPYEKSLETYLMILVYIYIIIIIIMSCRQHGYPWPSLATSPYHSPPPAGFQGYILCPHIVAVCKFELVVLLLHCHMWGSIGVHHLWARPCFSNSVPRVWFV